MSHRLLCCERRIGLAREVPFAPGLRPAVTSCHKLALPVHLEEGLTVWKRWNDGVMREHDDTIRSQALYPAELRARPRGKLLYCKGNPPSTGSFENPIRAPKMGVVCTGFAAHTASSVPHSFNQSDEKGATAVAATPRFFSRALPDEACYSRFPPLSRPESGREVRDDVGHGVREAVKAAIAAISSTVSLATTPFICGLNSPARVPLW